MWHLRGTGKLHRIFFVCVGRTVGKRQLRKPTRRWEIILKIDLQGVGWRDIDWIAMSQDKDSRRELLNAVMNNRVP